MRRPRPSIDAETLRAMYVDDRLTIEAIAARLGCGASSVGRRLHRLGIPTRSRGPAPTAAWSRGRNAAPTWSPQMAWLVGLVATDGNLGPDGRLSIGSSDVQLLDTAPLSRHREPHHPGHRRLGPGGWRLQWGDRPFYRWLVSLGLTPRKSLTLGPLAIPDPLFADFFRGCVDGDGTVLVYADRRHQRKNAAYVYERLYVSLVSASRPFIAWIRRTIHRLLALPGSVSEKRKDGRNPVWVLRYSKKASLRLLRWMYHSPDVPCLERKRVKARRFLPGRT